MSIFWKLLHLRSGEPRKVLGRITTSEGQLPASLSHLRPNQEYTKRVDEAFRPTPSQRIKK